MSARLKIIARRRELLVARAALQREEFAMHADELRPLLTIGSAVMRLGQVVRGHPVWAAVTAVVLWQVLKRPLRSFPWLARGLTVLTVIQRARSLWTVSRRVRAPEQTQAG